MRNISVLIKPASGLCNLKCKYCFYNDEMEKRSEKSFGMMNEKTVQNIIDKFLNIPDISSVFFAFQGGEPTLAGLDFYKNFIKLVNDKKGDKNIIYSIQTNGILLDEKWCEFFRQNNFLVGLSIDGIKDIHNKYRIDKNNAETFDDVYSKIELLNRHQVEFNILTVITKDIARNINKIYNFYKENNLIYQQYIPCLDQLDEKKGINNYSLLPHDYELFLNKLFSLYYNDIINGKYVYNRYFENLLLIISGKSPEICSMFGSCSLQYVIEGNGNVYPCDFYSIDKYLLGNINDNSIDELTNSSIAKSFIQESKIIPEKCKKCKYFKLCRTGCRRDKEKDGIIDKNYYCSAYYSFFEKNYDKLVSLYKHIISKNLK